MKGLRLTRRGKVVGAALLIALAGTLGGLTARYSWDGHGYSQQYQMAPCQSDDGSGPRPCYWNAQTQGNGQGRSFWVDSHDETHYDAPGE